jgi:hypothetical protein
MNMKKLTLFLFSFLMVVACTATRRTAITTSADHPRPTNVTLPPSQPVTDSEVATLRSQAKSYLTSIKASLTMDGTALPLDVWAQTMVNEAQHASAVAAKAAQSTSQPVIPNPGTSTYSQKAAAQLCLRFLLDTEAPLAGITVTDAQVNTLVIQQQSATANAPAGQQGYGLTPSSPSYANAIRQMLLEDGMRKHVLATTAGSTSAEQLATWMTSVMPKHNVATTGIPPMTYSNLETLLQ